MNYTPKDLGRFQVILNAFHDYLSNSPYVDILYTPKKGYIFLRIESDFLEASEIESPDELFEILISEITSDVRDLFLCGEHITITLYPAEIEESRSRIRQYIGRLPKDLQDYYAKIMENCFQHCNKE